MKQIILIILGAGLGFFGFTIEGVFHETTSMVAATMFFAEAINDWKEFKKWKAGATAVGVIGVLALAVMGYLVYALCPGVILITEIFVYLFTKRREK